MKLSWPFRRRTPDTAPEVKAAQAKRDELLGELGVAIREVDAGQKRLMADYKAANGLRPTGRKP